VATPPRAADMNEPVAIVGAAFMAGAGAGAGSSGGDGASGPPLPVIVTGAVAGGREPSNRSSA